MLTAFGLGRGDGRPRGLRSRTRRSTSDAVGDRRRPGVTEIPDETAGPYPGDGSNGPDVLEESGIVRSDIRSSFGDSTTHGRGRAAGARADHPGPGQRTTRRSPGSPSTSGTATARAGTRCTPRAWRTRTTCAASRSPTPTARSVHQHLPGLLLRPLAAHPLRGLPRRGVDHRLRQRHRHLPGGASRRTSATRSTPRRATRPRSPTWPRCRWTTDNVFGDDGGAHQLATVTGDVTNGLRRHPDRRRSTRPPSRPAAVRPVAVARAAPGGNPPSGERPSGAPGGGAPSGAPTASSTTG